MTPAVAELSPSVAFPVKFLKVTAFAGIPPSIRSNANAPLIPVSGLVSKVIEIGAACTAGAAMQHRIDKMR